MDLRRRTVTLPFQNGTYELTVSLANNLKIDENTVIGFNPETNCFEIIGKYDDFDMVFLRRYRDLDTSTVDIHVSEHKISADVKISQEEGNILKANTDGLYAASGDKVTMERFNSLVNSFRSYREDMEDYMNALAEIVGMEQGTGTLAERIDAALNKVYPEIDQALENFETYARKLDGLEDRVNQYTDEKFAEVKETLTTLFNGVFENPWEIFGDYNPNEPTTEPEEPDTGEDTETTEPDQEEETVTTPDDTETSTGEDNTEEEPVIDEEQDSTNESEPEIPSNNKEETVEDSSESTDSSISDEDSENTVENETDSSVEEPKVDDVEEETQNK